MTGLLVKDEGAGQARPTLDADAIAAITSYAGYAQFGERRRALGFFEDQSEDAPICRWVQAKLILDLMPLDEKILGFSNRWYRAAMESACLHESRISTILQRLEGIASTRYDSAQLSCSELIRRQMVEPIQLDRSFWDFAVAYGGGSL